MYGFIIPGAGAGWARFHLARVPPCAAGSFTFLFPMALTTYKGSKAYQVHRNPMLSAGNTTHPESCPPSHRRPHSGCTLRDSCACTVAQGSPRAGISICRGGFLRSHPDLPPLPPLLTVSRVRCTRRCCSTNLRAVTFTSRWPFACRRARRGTKTSGGWPSDKGGSRGVCVFGEYNAHSACRLFDRCTALCGGLWSPLYCLRLVCVLCFVFCRLVVLYAVQSGHMVSWCWFVARSRFIFPCDRSWCLIIWTIWKT